MNDDELAEQLRAWTRHDGDASAELSRFVSVATTIAADESPPGLPRYVGADGAPEPATGHSDVHGTGAWTRRVAVLVPVLLLGALIAFALTRSTTDVTTPTTVGTTTATEFTAGTCAAPALRPEHPSEQQAAQWDADAQSLNDEIARTGFARTRTIQQDGSYLCAWFRPYGPRYDRLQGSAATSDAVAVYDRPNGTVLGVAYMDLGYFPLDVVMAPGFDPTKLRIERYGCDPRSDQACTPTSTIVGAVK